MNANAIRLRSGTLDSLRGLTLFSMIAYHLCWDLVYLRACRGPGITAFGRISGSRASAVPSFCSPATAGRWVGILSAGAL